MAVLVGESGGAFKKNGVMAGKHITPRQIDYRGSLAYKEYNMVAEVYKKLALNLAEKYPSFDAKLLLYGGVFGVSGTELASVAGLEQGRGCVIKYVVNKQGALIYVGDNRVPVKVSGDDAGVVEIALFSLVKQDMARVAPGVLDFFQRLPADLVTPDLFDTISNLDAEH